MRNVWRLVLGGLALLVGVRLWAAVFGGRRRGAYYLTGARQVRLLFWPLAGLVASLPFVLGTLRRLPDLPAWVLGGVVLLAGALLSLSVPALVLHLRYRRQDAETVVLFDPQAAHLEVRRPDRPFLRIQPQAVRGVTWQRPRSATSFGAAYEALTFDFADSTPSLTLTSAVLELGPVVAWLRGRGITITERRRVWVWV